MRWKMAAAAAGTDQPAATAAKIKTASHTKFLTVPRIWGIRDFRAPNSRIPQIPKSPIL